MTLIKTIGDTALFGTVGYACISALKYAVEANRTNKWIYFVKEPDFFAQVVGSSAKHVALICAGFILVDQVAQYVFQKILGIHSLDKNVNFGRLALSAVATAKLAEMVNVPLGVGFTLSVVALSILASNRLHNEATEFVLLQKQMDGMTRLFEDAQQLRNT